MKFYKIQDSTKAKLAEIRDYLRKVQDLNDTSEFPTLTNDEAVRVDAEWDKADRLINAAAHSVTGYTLKEITDMVKAYEGILATPVTQRNYRSC